MSVLRDRVPRAELGTLYTHKGWFLGLVPVYVGDPRSPVPLVVERNGIPVWWFDLVTCLHMLLCDLMCLASPEFEPTFFITITAKLEPRNG